MARRASVKRISLYTFFLGLPVLGLIAALMLPRFIKLDTYRPEIQAQLQQASGRRVVLSDLEANLFPPSISAEKIVVFEQIPPHRPILIAQKGRLRLRTLPLFHGTIQIHSAIIERPRLIVYTDRLQNAPPGPTHASGSRARADLLVVIHDGQIELGGPLFGQNIRWAIDHVEATVQGTERSIRLSARPSFLGPSARLHVTFNPNVANPVVAVLTQANLDSVLSLFGPLDPVWRGATVEAQAEAQWPIMKRIDLLINRLSIPALRGSSARGALQISKTSVSGKLFFEGLISSMTVSGQVSARSKGWMGVAQIDQYSPEITRLFLRNYWIDALTGSGSLKVSATKLESGPCQLNLAGSGFLFAGTRFKIPSWTTSADGSGYTVSVDARTPDDQGRIKVQWSSVFSEPAATIDVSVSSITVGDVFDVFALRPSTPLGVEPWSIKEGRYRGTVDPEGRAAFENAALSLDYIGLKTSGQLDFSTAPASVRIEGQAQHIHLSPVLESLGVLPPPLVGMANATFDVRFPADNRWFERLNGRLGVQSENGFIRAGKVIYKMAGVLNLTKLLKPAHRAKTTDAGIPYQSASGSGTLINGMLATRDFKIKTENMDVSVKGEVNIPSRTIDAKIELQFLAFMKDSLGAIPLVKRVFTPDTGLVQIPVRIRGPLNNPEVN